ncbi:MAG: gamma-glutamyltransferase [Alphaproteobacteria bacterium]|nr:gamma-glutamyltransferase [Alphaproteobacteria bacterium]
MFFRHFLQIIMLFVLICVVAHPQKSHAADIKKPQPEMATGLQTISSERGESFMAVTANPYATQAAYDILSRGGSAVDAAIAAQLVLGLVEPQSSGLGGGAFALVYDAKSKRLHTYDGRETAPNLAGPFLFFENGEPLSFKEAVIGGRSVGVPGVPMLLSDLHEKYGVLTWMELFDDAIKLADEGFTVSPRMAKMVAADADDLRKDPAARAYFLPNDKPVEAGYNLKNIAYRDTLKDYQFYNARRFYRGEVARSIVYKVQNYDGNPGLLSLADFQNYSVKERPPVCGPYRAYIVCSMGQPSSGALTLLQILGMLEHFDIRAENAKSWHIIAQASALAFADRAIYMADPDFVNTPDIALINPDYLKSRAALIDPDKPLNQIKAGTPPDWNGKLFDAGETLTQPGTTHLSIIDKDGNIVSMTSSIEGAFGAHIMTDGFLLNNQLTDFSFNPLGDDRKFVANAVEPGKRPRSSMSPTIVFNAKGDPVLILGSSGGSRIINHVLQRIIAVIDWGVPIDDALAAPHILARGETIELDNPEYQAALEAMGDTTLINTINSGLTAIQIKDKITIGTADPRREGQAKGK